MSEQNKSIGDYLLGMVLGAIQTSYSFLLDGLIIYKFWGWFLIPTFKTLEYISYSQGIELAAFLMIFTKTGIIKIKDELKKDETEQAVISILLPLIILGLGWCIHLIF